MVRDTKNLEGFRALIDQDKLVVIDFWAEWCGPCRAIAPTFTKLAEDYLEVEFAKVDVDVATDKVHVNHLIYVNLLDIWDVTEELGIRSMPTFLFYKAGQKVGEVTGANPAALIKKVSELM